MDYTHAVTKENTFFPPHTKVRCWAIIFYSSIGDTRRCRTSTLGNMLDRKMTSKGGFCKLRDNKQGSDMRPWVVQSRMTSSSSRNHYVI